MQLGSMFISHCDITLHVSDAFCVHPQEYLKTVIAASTIVFKYSWGWTQKASKTCRVISHWLISILPSCIMLVLYMY